MRLLQKSLRSLLTYSLLLVTLSIPLSLISINYILLNEVDETLLLYRDEFIKHVRHFEYLEDLETDLLLLDDVVYDIDIRETDTSPQPDFFTTIHEPDSIENTPRPFRILVSKIKVKDKPYLLTMRISLANNNDVVMTLVTAQVIVALLLALGLVFINRKLSKKLWKPFYKTLNNLKEYELDKHKEIDLDQTEIIEFNDLNKTVRNLTERNRKVFLQQKEFIENVSHEMQTPLAILHSQVDMLMQSPNLSEDQSLLIEEVASSMQRLAKLNKNMLLLTKIENEQFTEQETCDMKVLIGSLVQQLKPMADVQGISIRCVLNTHHVTVNKTLLEVLLMNLLTNAIRYNESSGQVVILNEDGQFTIGNTGEPLKIPGEKLFDRFVKGTPNHGTGLGLAIVKKICDTCGYKLTYAYLDGMHQFSVTF